MVSAVVVDVALKPVDPTPTAVVKAATTWAEFPTLWRPMLDEVWSFLRDSAPDGLWTHGHNVMLYKDDVPNIEVGVQVNRSFEPYGSVVSSALPGGLAATATHAGPIAKIGETHDAVRDWVAANGYQPTGPRWEIYGDPDPSTGTFAVEVNWLVAAQAS
jgi:effector-binding domain-containing protein